MAVMSLSTKAIRVAAALGICVCGGVVLPRDSQAHQVTPDLPPCIDLVLLGRLRSLGEPEFIQLPDDLLGHSIYNYEIAVDRAIVGSIDGQMFTFSRLGHALQRSDREDAVLFFRRVEDGRLRFADAGTAVRDRHGRLFLPLLAPPDREFRGASWLPIGFERFMRPVDYVEASMARAGYNQEILGVLREGGRSGYIKLRDGRFVVLNGIYLDDIPEMLGSADEGENRCSR